MLKMTEEYSERMDITLYATGEIDIIINDPDKPGVQKFLIYFKNMDEFVELLSKNQKFWMALRDKFKEARI
jgi:hypothetical protein